MNIVLRNLEVNEGLSDETRAFSCQVEVDGRVLFHASNRGNGGCNLYHPIGEGKWDDIEGAKVWAQKSLNEDFEPLDALIENLIVFECNANSLRIMLKTGKVVCYHNGDLFNVSIPFTAENKKKVEEFYAKKHPGLQILNDMDFNFAVALISGTLEDFLKS